MVMDKLRHEVAQIATFYVTVCRKWKQVVPPTDLIKDMLGAPTACVPLPVVDAPADAAQNRSTGGHLSFTRLEADRSAIRWNLAEFREGRMACATSGQKWEKGSPRVAGLVV